MNNEFGHKKHAEDIFSDDILSEKLRNGESFNEDLSNEELLFSTQVLSSLASDKPIFDVREKDFLGKQISLEINRAKRKKLFLWVGSAASLLIILGLTLFFELQHKSGILDFASSIITEPGKEYTQLLLPKGKVIHIETPESKIAYSSNGQEILIDSKEVEQSLADESGIYNTIVVPYGKRSCVTLSDHTVIWLNSGTKLVYPIRFTGSKREVYLDGEALFEVSHDEDHPFHVLTQHMEVKVLGTVFDLSAYAEDSLVNTVLQKGSVQLIYNKNMFGASTETIVPGTLAMFDLKNRSVSNQKINAESYISWKDGYLVFEKQSLESIVKRLSRYYNVSIDFECPDMKQETFSGNLDLRNSAIQVLGIISEIVDIEVTQSGNVIKISRKHS